MKVCPGACYYAIIMLYILARRPTKAERPGCAIELAMGEDAPPPAF